jgi:hypothetical protein
MSLLPDGLPPVFPAKGKAFERVWLVMSPRSWPGQQTSRGVHRMLGKSSWRPRDYQMYPAAGEANHAPE